MHMQGQKGFNGWTVGVVEEGRPSKRRRMCRYGVLMRGELLLIGGAQRLGAFSNISRSILFIEEFHSALIRKALLGRIENLKNMTPDRFAREAAENRRKRRLRFEKVAKYHHLRMTA